MDNSLTKTEIRADENVPVFNVYTWYIWRHLAKNLIIRDIKVRYKQTLAGFFWVIAQPAATALIMSFVLGKIANLETGQYPVTIFIFVGVIAWQFCSTGVNASSNCILNERGLIVKVYFPRVILIVSSILSYTIDFLIGFTVLVVVLTASGYPPSWTFVLTPLVIVPGVLAILSFSLILGPLSAVIRDFRYISGFLIQFLVFATPVFFPFNLVPENLQFIFALNPFLHVIEIYRWLVLGEMTCEPVHLLVSLGAEVFLLFVGVKVFRLIDRRIVDYI